MLIPTPPFAAHGASRVASRHAPPLRPALAAMQHRRAAPPGGVIFLVDAKTEHECLSRRLGALPGGCRPLTESVTRGTPVFVYNTSTRVRSAARAPLSDVTVQRGRGVVLTRLRCAVISRVCEAPARCL